MRLKSIEHVQLAMPPGREAEARRFYGELLGIPEKPKPPARKAHPAFVVEDLPALEAALRAAGVAVRSDEPLAGYQRIFVDDPFGNRLELMEPG